MTVRPGEHPLLNKIVQCDKDGVGATRTVQYSVVVQCSSTVQCSTHTEPKFMNVSHGVRVT